MVRSKELRWKQQFMPDYSTARIEALTLDSSPARSNGDRPSSE
jgi:hypothetical protein